MMRSQLTPRLEPAGSVPESAGYVYVLATAHCTNTGIPIVKIGMTKRTPEKRVAELSRGGPVGMTLEGFVTSRDPGGLERQAHQNFAAAKYIAGGGTEYFALRPVEALAWLRSNSPRFELDSARQSAWKEYCESTPFKQHSRITSLPLNGAFAGFWIGLFLWHPNEWVVLLANPAIGIIAGGLIAGLLLRPLRRRLAARCSAVRSELEEKYHLPLGGVRASL